jgi:hypothetical protein
MNKQMATTTLLALCFTLLAEALLACPRYNYASKYEMAGFSVNGRYFIVANNLPAHCEFVRIKYLPNETNGVHEAYIDRIARTPSNNNFFFQEYAVPSALHAFHVLDSNLYSFELISDEEPLLLVYNRVILWKGIEISNLEARSFGGAATVSLNSYLVKSDFVEAAVVASDYSGMQHKFMLENTTPTDAYQNDSYMFIDGRSRYDFEQTMAKFICKISNASQYSKIEVVVDDNHGHRLFRQEVPIMRTNFEVYPTAFTNKLVIVNNVAADAFCIVNQYGIAMYNATLAENTTTAQLPNLSPGMYMLCLYRKGELLGSKKVLRING